MLVLAIDTSAAQCAACVFDAGENRELGRRVLDLGKGHAEHLMAVIDKALDDANVGYADIGRIAVCIGPGSFTGVRVGVATARGLTLALKVQAVGISSLEAVAAQVRAQHRSQNVLVAFQSVENALQAALYDTSGNVLAAPAIMTLEQATALADEHRPVLAGTAAQAIAAKCESPLTVIGETTSADIAFYGRLATTKGDDEEKPKPLYLREPDAKPQAGFVLPRA